MKLYNIFSALKKIMLALFINKIFFLPSIVFLIYLFCLYLFVSCFYYFIINKFRNFIKSLFYKIKENIHFYMYKKVIYSIFFI